MKKKLRLQVAHRCRDLFEEFQENLDGVIALGIGRCETLVQRSAVRVFGDLEATT